MAFLPSFLGFVRRPGGPERTHQLIGTKSLFTFHLILTKKKKKIFQYIPTRVPLGARVRNSNRSLAAYSAGRDC